MRRRLWSTGVLVILVSCLVVMSVADRDKPHRRKARPSRTAAPAAGVEFPTESTPTATTPTIASAKLGLITRGLGWKLASNEVSTETDDHTVLTLTSGFPRKSTSLDPSGKEASANSKDPESYTSASSWQQNGGTSQSERKAVAAASRRRLRPISSSPAVNSSSSSSSSSSMASSSSSLLLSSSSSTTATTATTKDLLTDSGMVLRRQRCTPDKTDCALSKASDFAVSGTTLSKPTSAAAAASASSSSFSPSSSYTGQSVDNRTQFPLGLQKSTAGTVAPVYRGGSCSACDVRHCPGVFPESCAGQIRKDACNCCPVCTEAQDHEPLTRTPPPVPAGNSVCDSVRCPRGKVCLLNIQGLPMCRCLSVFHCRRLPEKSICTTAGLHFKNRCFMSVEECNTGRTLTVLHDGRCYNHTSAVTQSPEPTRPQYHIPMSDERVRHHHGHRLSDGGGSRKRQHRHQKYVFETDRNSSKPEGKRQRRKLSSRSP